mmetsp:Transcript_34283/g.110100  ORF Transcript_34283/g.110100 Transcript_34283/m.110100 type:complete len:221 (-) Transcript_34283:95-757(-)
MPQLRRRQVRLLGLVHRGLLHPRPPRLRLVLVRHGARQPRRARLVRLPDVRVGALLLAGGGRDHRHVAGAGLRPLPLRLPPRSDPRAERLFDLPERGGRRSRAGRDGASGPQGGVGAVLGLVLVRGRPRRHSRQRRLHRRALLSLSLHHHRLGHHLHVPPARTVPQGARPVAQPLPVGGVRLPRGQGRVPRRLLLHHVDGRAPPLRAPLAPLCERRPREL